MASEVPARSVMRYFGGKWRIAPWIISHFPKHRVYVEPFGGVASVLLQKPRAFAEIYNDLSLDVWNLFRTLRDPALAADLERRVRLTPFSRMEFDLAYGEPTDDIDRARYLIVRAMFGFGSNGARMQKNGFRSKAYAQNTTPQDDWMRYPDVINQFTTRLQGVVIENRDYRALLEDHDAPHTLFYLDPPYILDTRSGRHRYTHELSNDDHQRLIDAVANLQGMVILSGYAHDAYERLGWARAERKTLADGARERTEVLWLNPAVIAAQSQMSFNLG